MTARTFVGLRSTRPRAAPPDLVVLHWTGGTGGLQRLYDVLRATTGPRSLDGLSVHAGIDTAGTVERWAPDDLVCLHAGGVNDRSLGIEVCSPGFSTGSAWLAEQRRGVQRTAYEDKIRGRRARMLDYTAAQHDAVFALVTEWCDRHGIPRAFPVEADGSLMRRQMTARELARFRGVIGHYHCHDSKCDPGTAPFLELARRWGVPLT
jgi:N-acetyl-anhydromuramyl-L-alanine amidase AmpD